MIAVKKPDLPIAEWQQWHEDAIAASEKAQGEFQTAGEVKVKAEVYKAAMPFLLSLFNNKCAYCESLITNTHPGDVEHYRPKGRLKDADGHIVKIKRNGKETEHPGYWWLSYEWANLLPSCIDCNRRRNHRDGATPAGEAGDAAGKADFFPIDGVRASDPKDPLKDEAALLLNPTDSDFDSAAEFELQATDGRIKPLTKRAQTTCDLLGLNIREKLVEQRFTELVNAENAIMRYVALLWPSVLAKQPASDAAKDAARRVNEMWEGRTAHTAFARLAISGIRENMKASSVNIELPIAIK